MRKKYLLSAALMMVCAGLSYAVEVSWDGAAAEIVALTNNVNSSPGAWTALDTVWSTTDEVVPAVGSQTSFKSAISKIPAQARIAQVNYALDAVYVGGNEEAPTTNGSPYCTLVGFDTAAFSYAGPLSEISLDIKSRPNDSGGMGVRWFIEAGGNTYVSDVIGTIGTTRTVFTLTNPQSIPWFDFDPDVNIDAAIGDTSSLLDDDILSAVTRVGYYTASYFSEDANWHGAQMYKFSATAISTSPTSTNWTNGEPGSNLWSSGANWSDGLPGGGTQANIHESGPALIDSSVEAVATGTWCRWGITDPNADSTVLNMTGGSLTVSSLALGNSGPAIVNMSDGTISASGNLNIGDSDGGDTTFNINGGTVNIGGTVKSKINATTNFINFNGGVMTVADISLTSGVDPNYPGTIMDIAGGTLILDGDQINPVIDCIADRQIIAYGGTGEVLLDYDVTNSGKTTVSGFELVFEHGDFTGDNYVDMDDLEVLAREWLFQRPTQLAWPFDMDVDPVGQGDFELEIRDPAASNNHYIMGDDTGTGTLEVTGEGLLLLDSHIPEAVALFDTTIHYTVKTTSSSPLNLWYTMGTSTDPGKQAYVGISTSLSSGVQSVEIWTGVPPEITGYAPVIESSFDGNAYLDVTINYHYDTDTFDYTITDGINPPKIGTDIAYTYFSDGDGGKITLMGKNGATGFVDQLDVTIDGSTWYAESDIQPDGSVDPMDLSIVADEWLVDKYAPFAWDHVPLYAHVGIGDGLELDQYNFLADKFDLITLTGGPMPSGTMEPNFGVAAHAIKQRNPNVKLLAYWASDKPKGQWKLTNATFPEGGWLPIETPNFDLCQQSVRDWWTDAAAMAIQVYGCDGIFVDGLTAGRPDGPWSRDLGAEHAALLDEATFTMMREVREKMGPGKLVVFNPLHGYVEGQLPLGEQYLPVTDGAMVDDFDRAANLNQQSAEYMANTIEIMRDSAKDGNIIVFKAWPGFTWWSDPDIMAQSHEEQYQVAKDNILFPLACFLIGAEKNCYFCYTWGWLAEYGTFDWYPEFDKPLGSPLGDAVRDGWTYQREFEHASVFLDLENKIGQIDWTEP